MEKANMHSLDMVNENIKKIGNLFPECVTETVDENGNVKAAIDFEKLQENLSHATIGEGEERYQFTWPGKREAIHNANAPTNMTLRPCKEESVDFDNTENLYIEGDNLEVLKLLQENYLGKVKMIYIDPPYNTGNDFVYNDDFKEDTESFQSKSGMYDEDGNMLLQNFEKNTESNGRFHTDWLNMMYPRLKIARNLLSDDGVIFIHIDEHEVFSLNVMCREIFGGCNELGTIIWDKRNPKGSVAGVAYQHESILVFCKNIAEFAKHPFVKKKEHAEAMLLKVTSLIKKYGGVNETVRKEFKEYVKQNKNELSGGEAAYSLIDDEGNLYRQVSMAAPDKPETRSHRPLIHPITGKPCPVPQKGWRFTDTAMDALLEKNKIDFGENEKTQPRQKYLLKENLFESVASLLYFGGNDDALGVPFDNPKPVYVAKKIIDSVCRDNDIPLVLDFFSGSATTAHAVMQLNAEDGGKRKFICVQLPEATAEDSEAYKAGYKNICEIGKERIRRAGKKIKEEFGEKAKDLDIGFRVLKLADSNMKDVYYSPAETTSPDLFDPNNVKEDRTPLDLLFQVMPECNLPLSSKIEERTIEGKTVYFVNGNYLVACFDEGITEKLIKAVIDVPDSDKPYYFYMRGLGLESDKVLDNFEQLFVHYSPTTKRKVI